MVLGPFIHSVLLDQLFTDCGTLEAQLHPSLIDGIHSFMHQ